MVPNIIISSLSLLKKSPIAEYFANLGILGWIFVILFSIFTFYIIVFFISLGKSPSKKTDRPKSIQMDVDDLKNKIRSGEIKVVIRNPDNSQKTPTEMDLDEIIEKIRSGEIKATLRKD